MSSKTALKRAIDGESPIVQAGQALVRGAVWAAANESGRTVEEQWDRMGDRYARLAAEIDPEQKQLDDYAVSGPTVPVEP